MRTAAIYARVSTSDQVKGTSLDGQVDACQGYAAANGYAVTRTVQEDASGARLDRPKLGELRDMAQRREIDALIVFDPDRLSRSMVHTMMLMEEFERNSAGVLFVNAPREDTPEGEMLFGIRALFAQYERTKIAERTRRGKERRLREGQIMMSAKSAPFGFRYVPIAHTLEIVESEAVWVRRMYEWVVYENCSLRQVARRLDAFEVKTRGGADHWHPEVVSGILQNELYAGTWHYGKRKAIEPRFPHKRRTLTPKQHKSSREHTPPSEWFSVSVPALVPRELYDAVQGRMERNKAMSSRNSKYEYLLKSMLFCGRCGYRMYGATRTASEYTPQRSSYKCTGRNIRHKHLPADERCTQGQILGVDLESLVWGEVVRQLSDEKELRARLEKMEAERRTSRKDDETELQTLIALELGLKREADKLIDYAMDDVIDKATLRERMATIKEKQAGIARSKADVTARLAQSDSGPGSADAIQRLCDLARRGLPRLNFEERRAFLEGMDVKVTIDGDKVTIVGLITDRTLSLAGRYADTSSEDPQNGVLCHTPSGRTDTINTTSALRLTFHAVLQV